MEKGGKPCRFLYPPLQPTTYWHRVNGLFNTRNICCNKVWLNLQWLVKQVLLACALFLMGCASQTIYSDSDRIDLRIQNDSWSTSRVRIYCEDGSLLTTIHGLGFTETTSKSVRLPNSCPAIMLEVSGFGNRELSGRRMVVPQETVCARINSLMQVVWHIGCYL